MDSRTREALEGSIRKWQKIVDGTQGCRGATNCELCQVFLNADAKFPCQGCPVRERSGRFGCRGTPYIDWIAEFDWKSKWPRYANTPARLEAAKAELAFLISLRPSEEPSQ